MSHLETSIAADREIRALVETFKAKYPDLGLSYGYIGNLERQRDDRSFRIFTNRRSLLTGSSISYHCGGFASLPAALERLKAGAFAPFSQMAEREPRAY